MGSQWLNGEQDLVHQRTLHHDRQFGFAGAILLCLLVEALVVLAAVAIYRLAT